jgi:hypothetical protein
MLTQKQSFVYLPQSPTSTKGVIFRMPWYTEREEIIMTNVRVQRLLVSLYTDIVQRVLRDDPAKGLTALK